MLSYTFWSITKELHIVCLKWHIFSTFVKKLKYLCFLNQSLRFFCFTLLKKQHTQSVWPLYMRFLEIEFNIGFQYIQRYFQKIKVPMQFSGNMRVKCYNPQLMGTENYSFCSILLDMQHNITSNSCISKTKHLPQKKNRRAEIKFQFQIFQKLSMWSKKLFPKEVLRTHFNWISNKWKKTRSN